MQEQILDALDRGDTEAALQSARAYAAASPDELAAHVLLAMALRGNGDLDGAVQAMDRAIALDPGNAGLHMDQVGLQLARRDAAAADVSLKAAVAADPNTFAAYATQAHLALGRRDFAEVERQLRLAARVEPGHPTLLVLEGLLALARGNGAAAVSKLSAAVERAPEDPLALHALGFAHFRQGQFAFAEQAFGKLLERVPAAQEARMMIALMRERQGRAADGLEAIAPLLADPASATPQVRRFAGELALGAGRAPLALEHLRAAFAAMPGEARATTAIVEAWRRTGLADEARGTLEAALATAPENDGLWRARLVFDPGGEEGAALVARWRKHSPESINALDAEMTLHAMEGRTAEAEAAARALLGRAPDHFGAEARLADALLDTDPAAAVQRIEALLARTDLRPEARGTFDVRLGLARHRAGDFAAALEHWNRRNATPAPGRLPLPAATPPPAEWPAAAAPVEGAAPVAFLLGLPGGLAERGAQLLKVLPTFRDDRVGARPPADVFQDIGSWQGVAAGRLPASAVIDTWRRALPRRGIHGAVIDWLPWWDNSYTSVVRAALPEARLLVMLRDPRDMLLDWIATGAGTPFHVGSPQAAADWLAAALDQVATIHELDLIPHHLIRLDGIAEDPAAISAKLAEALEITLPPPPAGLFGAPRFADGSWRAHAGALAGPFATLAPVARRLGYPDA